MGGLKFSYGVAAKLLPTRSCPLWGTSPPRTLRAQGLVPPVALLLGLDVSADGGLIGQDGTISDSLYAVGPARKGNLWESTAVPEIREQVYKLVDRFVYASSGNHLRLG